VPDARRPFVSPRIGGLFFGYGGLDMAVQEVIGGELAWVSEIDKGACKIIAHRFPGVPNIGDITKVDWTQVEPVDVLTGGSPCQDLSTAGGRAGMTEGTRSNLWVAMREAIAVLRPRLVVWENVRGAYSAAADSAVEPCPGCVGDGPGVHLRALGRVLGDLSSLGYDAQWHGLRAADVGAAHGRFRVFVIATDATSNAGRFGHGDGGAAAVSDRLGLEWARGARAGWAGPEDGRLMPTPSVADALGGHERRGGARGDELLLNGVAKEMDGARWGDYAAAIARWGSVIGRPAPEPTQTSSKGNPQLSAAFVEWLMGLPAGWITDVPGITRNESLKAAGNGVVPQQAAAALRIMLARAETAA
jgi:DNA (cytosine-5)-methyltransferase 1